MSAVIVPNFIVGFRGVIEGSSSAVLGRFGFHEGFVGFYVGPIGFYTDCIFL